MGGAAFWLGPGGVGGVDRASISHARGSGFESLPVWKYHFFTLKFKGLSEEPGAPPDLWIELRRRGEPKKCFLIATSKCFLASWQVHQSLNYTWLLFKLVRVMHTLFPLPFRPNRREYFVKNRCKKFLQQRWRMWKTSSLPPGETLWSAAVNWN